MIEDRKKLYWSEGGNRTERWKEEKKRVAEVIKNKKRGYMDTQRDRILGHVKSFSSLEKPKIFEVKDLNKFKDKTDAQVAEELAVFFDWISKEFELLEPHQIPVTKLSSSVSVLCLHKVAARLKIFRKPKLMVPRDVFQRLVTILLDFFAIPLTDIYNEITRTKVWPRKWKKEFVTIIPKKPSPQSMSDLRNISCTILASKVYETYVLDWLKSEGSILGVFLFNAMIWKKDAKIYQTRRSGPSWLKIPPRMGLTGRMTIRTGNRQNSLRRCEARPALQIGRPALRWSPTERYVN